MKILVIGNSGFIGKFLIPRLIKERIDIVGFDLKKPQDNFKFIQGDVLNREKLEMVIQSNKIDTIIHLAAKHHDFGISEQEYFETNVKGTENILKCATKFDIKKIVFFSSVSIYGKGKKGYYNERLNPSPVTPYGNSKLFAEKLIEKWTEEDKKRSAVIIRPAVVFGPYNYANMYRLIDSIYRGRFIFVGKGNNVKSVAYVENLVEAIIFLLRRMRSGVEIYNYSDYPQLTTDQLVEVISQNLNRHVPRLKIPLGLVVVMASIFDSLGRLTGYDFPVTAYRIKKFNTTTYCDSEKIRKVGFKQPIDLYTGFRKTVEWYFSNGREDA